MSNNPYNRLEEDMSGTENSEQNQQNVGNNESSQPAVAVVNPAVVNPPVKQDKHPWYHHLSVWNTLTLILSILATITALVALTVASVSITNSSAAQNALSALQTAEEATLAHTVYTRWGHKMCPDGARILYTGLMAGHRKGENGGTNFLCTPRTGVEYNTKFVPGIQRLNIIYGTEYRTALNAASHHNVPCAVCLAAGRTTTIMIPARITCPVGRREYYGYLMAQNQDYGTYECVDIALQFHDGSYHHVEELAQLVPVEASCTGLPCHPYMNHKEMSCVVCTV